MELDKQRYISKIKNKQHFVYRWINEDTGEYYIGKHSGSDDDGYIASGRLFLERYFQTDKSKWSRTILGFFVSSDAAYHNEKILLGDLYKIDPLCLNLVAGGKGNDERKIKNKEYSQLVKNKYINDTRITLADRIGQLLITRYVYIGQNLNGQSKVFNTIPQFMSNLYHYAKEASSTKFPYDFLINAMNIKNIVNNRIDFHHSDEFETLACDNNWQHLYKTYILEMQKLETYIWNNQKTNTVALAQEQVESQDIVQRNLENNFLKI